MRIFYSSKFRREYKTLPRHIRKSAEEREAIFRKNLFDPRLNTHKLSGRFDKFWAFGIGQKYRIIFEFHKKSIVWFHSIGDHSVYQ